MDATPPPLPASAIPVKRWRLWAHLLLVLPYPLLAASAGSSRHDSHRSALTGGWQGLLKVCSVELVLFGTVLALALWASRTTRDDLLLRLRGLMKLVPLGIGYSVAVRMALGILAAVIVGILVLSKTMTMEAVQAFATQNKPDIETVVNVKALKNDPVYYWLSLTFVSFIVAGLREELWRSASLVGLRKLWPQRFGSQRGQLVGVVLTSILFGIGHLPQGLVAVGLTAVLGIALGTIMVLHRSAWPAIIAHGMFDATSFALVPLVMGHQ